MIKRRDFLSYLGGLVTVPFLGLGIKPADAQVIGVSVEPAGSEFEADFIAFDKDGFTINWSNVQQPSRTFEDQEPYGFQPPHQQCKKWEKDK